MIASVEHPSRAPSAATRHARSAAPPDRSHFCVALSKPAMLSVPSAARAPRSSLRELMSSFVNTLPRWHSTVRGLMNSWAPISGFVSPSPASRAICASCAVSSSCVSTVRLRTRLAGGEQLAAGALGERFGADAAEHVVGGTQLLAGVQARFSRRSHSP